MTHPTAEAFAVAMEATWPPAARHIQGPWTLRDGAGGGKRVSAATAHGPVSAEDLHVAEAAMRALGQQPLFSLSPGETDLDLLLEHARYRIVDPVTILAAPIAEIAATPPPPVTVFLSPEPLAIMREIWAEGGIGTARLAVMARAEVPKMMILGRSDDRPAGCGYAGIHNGIAMIHALEVRPDFRRRGTARNMVRGLAVWAAGLGATWLALAVTRANAPALALYRSLGMREAGGYHYRMAPEDAPS